MSAGPRVLYLDLVGGVAGDMLMAALLDAGASFEAVQAAVNALGLEGIELRLNEVSPAGLRALQLDVMVGGVLADSVPVPGGHDHLVLDAHDHDHGHPHDHGHGHDHSHDHDHGHHHGHRPYREVRDLIQGAALAARVKDRAQDTFRRLAEAEALAHGLALEDVVFHEVGADDAIVDIVGVCAAIESLQLARIVVSPPPLGRGLTRGGHGPIPLPGPATLHLLKGVPTAQTALVGETVTPTGAALITALADAFGDAPSMILESVGVGAGHKTWPDRPNVVRALVGRAVADSATASMEDCVIEANLDDLSPELLSDLEAALFAAGALDVWMTPIHMKKGRPGITVSALARRTLQAVLTEAFMNHSSTLGVRVLQVGRLRADRRMQTVQTPYGEVRVKRAPRSLGSDLVAPEHDDCARLAAAAAVPVRVVYEAALKAAWAQDV